MIVVVTIIAAAAGLYLYTTMEHEQLVSHIFGVNIAADVAAVIVTVATTAAVVVVVAAITTQIYIYVRCRFECDVMVIM